MTGNQQRKRTIKDFEKGKKSTQATGKNSIPSAQKRKSKKQQEKENLAIDQNQDDQFAVDLKSAGNIRSLYDVFTENQTVERTNQEMAALFPTSKANKEQDSEFSKRLLKICFLYFFQLTGIEDPATLEMLILFVNEKKKVTGSKELS